MSGLRYRRQLIDLIELANLDGNGLYYAEHFNSLYLYQLSHLYQDSLWAPHSHERMGWVEEHREVHRCIARSACMARGVARRFPQKVKRDLLSGEDPARIRMLALPIQDGNGPSRLFRGACRNPPRGINSRGKVLEITWVERPKMKRSNNSTAAFAFWSPAMTQFYLRLTDEFGFSAELLRVLQLGCEQFDRALLHAKPLPEMEWSCPASGIVFIGVEAKATELFMRAIRDLGLEADHATQ